MASRVEHVHTALAGVLVTAVCYGYALHAPLLWDDMDVVTPRGVRLTLLDLPQIFAPDHWLSVDTRKPRPYRPLRDVFLAAVGDAAATLERHLRAAERPLPDWRSPVLADRVAWGYHVGNLLLHALNVYLVWLLAKRLLSGRVGPAISALLFAAHPVHIEAVVWAKNAAELAALASLLGAMLCFMRAVGNEGSEGASNAAAAHAPLPGLWAASVVLYLFGIMSKEAALPLPALLLVWALLWRRGAARRRAAWMTLPLWAGGLLFTVFQYAFLGAVPGRVGGDGGMSARLTVCAASVQRYALMALMPLRYVPLYGRSSVSAGGRFSAIAAVVAFALLAALLVVHVRRGARGAFGFWWFLAALAPVSNLVGFNSARPLAEQRLYVPSVGLALLAGALFSRLRRSGAPGALGTAAALILALCFAALTVRQSPNWRTNLGFWRWASRASPREYMPLYNGGIMYAQAAQKARLDGDRDVAESAERLAAAMYHRALERAPTAADAWLNLGNTYRRRAAEAVGERRRALLDEAARCYRRGLAVAPTYAQLHWSLGWTCIDLGAKQQAAEEIRLSRLLDRSRGPAATALLAQLYFDTGQQERAMVEVLEAIEMQPERAALYRLAGDISEALNLLEQARRYRRIAADLRRNGP